MEHDCLDSLIKLDSSTIQNFTTSNHTPTTFDYKPWIFHNAFSFPDFANHYRAAYELTRSEGLEADQISYNVTLFHNQYSPQHDLYYLMDPFVSLASAELRKQRAVKFN